MLLNPANRADIVLGFGLTAEECARPGRSHVAKPAGVNVLKDIRKPESLRPGRAHSGNILKASRNWPDNKFCRLSKQRRLATLQGFRP
jgi:hypothetical protein